ncbi:MAG: sugar phosphate nucleotidyltransferase [Flavobacteriales bacterium AspAUS03]
MKIVIPMAGKGSRLRPHTLTVPKPLIPIAGKPIVQRLVENVARAVKTPIEEIVFIIGDFGQEIEKGLIQVAKNLGTKASICHQEQPLGTAHALLCAKAAFNGPMVIAFADTLFRADFDLNTEADGLIWTKQVENPSAYGVLKCDAAGYITDFVEKPVSFVSDLAIIGIYYVKNSNILREELEYLLDQYIKENGEYQLTNALENMRKKGLRFLPRKVDEWMDSGNKNAIIDTNSKILEFERGRVRLIHLQARIKNSLIIEPCFIGADAVIENSKVGPYVSIGKHTIVKNSNIETSLIQDHTEITYANLSNSMIGNNTTYIGVAREISLGDYSVFGF